MPPGPASGALLAIEVDHLVKDYPGGVRALDGLSFGVEVGTVAALLGPPGAGKSTALRILGARVRADGGRAWVAGADLGAAPEVVRRRAGYVGLPNGIDPAVSGRETLLSAGRRMGLTGRVLHRRADELLHRFDLAASADRPARHLGTGAQRRLGLALGLVHDPGLLLVDQPTTGADPDSCELLRVELARACHEEGRTVLFATDDVGEAARLASHLVLVVGGRVVAEGDPQRLHLAPDLSPDPAPDLSPDPASDLSVRNPAGEPGCREALVTALPPPRSRVLTGRPWSGPSAGGGVG